MRLDALQHLEGQPASPHASRSLDALRASLTLKLQESVGYQDAQNVRHAFTSLRPFLRKVEQSLPAMLEHPQEWFAHIYEDTRSKMERLSFRLLDGGYVSLHRIHPVPRGEALYHFHQWPSAIHVVQGGYRMGVGSGDGDRPPAIDLCTDVLPGTVYEMPNRNTWHFVEPKDVSSSIMVMGRNWNRPPLVTNRTLNLLPVLMKPAEKERMIDGFLAFAEQFQDGSRKAAE